MELWNEARGIPRYDVSSWGQVFDKTNNHVVNLELATRSGNMIHAFERIGGEAHDS